MYLRGGLRCIVVWAAFLILTANFVTATAAPPAKPGAETLAALRHTAVPTRDPVDLARRLLGLKAVPAPRTAVPEYQIGDVTSFVLENTDKNVQFSVSARLWYKTPHVYMWFQAGYQPDLAAVKRSADTFEAHIYPTVHAYFGREASPGIDGDVHLYIVNARRLGSSVAGYFASNSQYPRAAVPSSSEHEMFVINLDTMGKLIGTDMYNSTLAHEFQHMVRANVDPGEEAWIDEGMSVLSELLNGYPDLGYAAQFLGSPGTQLNTWSPLPAENDAHYGAAFLFVTYFLQRFGEDALRQLAANPVHDLDGVADTLRQIQAEDPATGQPVTVADLFADWTMANLLDDPGVADGRFAYPRLPDKPPFAATAPAVISDAWQDVPVSQWGTTYLDVTEPGRYRFALACAPTIPVVPVAPHSGQWMWWSNRGDHADTHLTRAFDLTGVTRATLSFWLWYAIEKDWDYGYVEVSTDGGATWKPVASQDSVPAGGHNNPYGPAYTGYSGGTVESAHADTATAAWTHQTVDLTPYAGKSIQVRFEYLTDDEVNEAGMLLDDIQIPEINYQSGAETGPDGWQADGWARIDNVLPESYVVQLAEFGPTPRVIRLLDAQGGTQSRWTLDVGGTVSRLTISLSGLAEYTVSKAYCQYQLTPII